MNSVSALHKTLKHHGLAAEESYRFIYEVLWQFYTQMAEPPFAGCRAANGEMWR